jgi:hypothetical protein
MKANIQNPISSAFHFVVRFSLSFALVTTTWAAQTTVDFEGLPGMTAWSYNNVPTESKLSSQLVSTYGTVFSSESACPYVAVIQLGSGHATSGINGIGSVNGDNMNDYGTPFRIYFFLPSSPSTPATTDFVSIRNDLLASSYWPVTLQAYDYSGNLLGSATQTDSYAFTLSLNVPGIHYVRIVAADSIAFDDLTFNSLVAVPEPSSLALTGMIGAALSIARVCGRKRATHQ